MARKKRLDVNEVLDRERCWIWTSGRTKHLYQDGGIYPAFHRRQREDGWLQPENQEKLVRTISADQQDMRLHRLYIDNGATGTVFQRPAFDEMMQDMKEGKINCIVVKDLSRLGRIIWRPGTIWNRSSRFSGCGLFPSQTAMTAILQM